MQRGDDWGCLKGRLIYECPYIGNETFDSVILKLSGLKTSWPK